MDYKKILSNRTLSSFNVSIGTGIALEALFTPVADRYDDSIIVDRYDKDFTTLYLSAYTLVRNILQSVTTQERKELYKDLDAKYISKTLEEEYETILAIAETQNKEVVIFDYTPIIAKGAKQVEARMTNNEYTRIIASSTVKRLKIHRLNRHVKGVMLTSLGFDLLQNDGVWLRSHTGKVLDRYHFNKVYHKLKTIDIEILPFNKTLLSIFGDNTGLVPVPKPRDRKTIYDYLLENKVTPYRSENWCKERLKEYYKNQGETK